MAYNNNQPQRSYPSVVLSSYGSIEGNHKFFSMDIWSNKLMFTFGDSSNKEKSINVKVLISAEKAEYVNYLIRDIYRKRIDAYLKNEPYANIPEEQAYSIECVQAFGNQGKEIVKYRMLIYTSPVDGIPRVTLKLVGAGIDGITIILGSKTVETSCVDPNNVVRFLDKTDTVLARLSKDLNDVTKNLTLYKMFSTFFDFFIGPREKNKTNNNNGQKYGNNYAKTGNYESSSTSDDITM